jgi:MerR family transcriptional regulator, light-induced transcriptional regulator
MRHPIGVVSEQTGLSPDVIRVWERRYGVVSPERDEAGRRLYTDEDVARLRLLARATSGGRGIGQVADLGLAELEELVRSDEAGRRGLARRSAPVSSGAAERVAERVVERALARTRALDRGGLEWELRRAATALDLGTFLEGVVASLFVRIGDEWHGGRLSVAQEHLASTAAAAVLGGLVGQAATGVGPDAPGLVVATPAGDRHEIGALLVAAEAVTRGWRVTYLGADLPAAEIVRATRDTGARCVALSLIHGANGGSAGEVAAVRAGLPEGVDVVVGGAGSTAAGGLAGVRRLEGLTELRSYLAEG